MIDLSDPKALSECLPHIWHLLSDTDRNEAMAIVSRGLRKLLKVSPGPSQPPQPQP